MIKILIIRNDKLGDFMLAWPALSLLKTQYPDASITVLIPSYTKPIAEICPWIDDIIIDDDHKNTLSDARTLAKKLKTHDFHLSISLYSETRTAMALWLAKIPQRFGPATKLAQLFLNKTLKQKRSRSLKPEHEYNVDLIRHYMASRGDESLITQEAPFLQFDAEETKNARLAYLKKNRLETDRKLIFIHVGSGGSAINLSLSQYAELATLIHQTNKAHFVLTAGPGELNTAK
ncbi:MAG: glycosyltransferase family 9 protein, partial [Gammaproteobacteria bacterium]|nr:glycosyltransferase family 9 protein [Gammaproteobacteria bacterium]